MSSSANRDLPIPGSPVISTLWPRPALTRSHACNNSSISALRPTSGNGVAAGLGLRVTFHQFAQDLEGLHLP